MARRVVAGASLVVFGLLAVVVHLLVGWDDEGFPVALGAQRRITLDVDFGGTAAGEGGAVDVLRSWDAEAGLGLVKLTADLDADLRGRVLIPLSDGHSLPETVGWYSAGPPARVVGPEAWEDTSPSGRYLVAGDPSRVPELVAALEEQGVVVTRTEASLGNGLQGLYRLRSLFVAFLTGCVLLATLVLYWLAVKSRSRALQVLGGVPVARVQVHDLGQLLLLVGGVWLAVSAAATVVAGLGKGWVYAPLFASYLGALGGLMVAVVLVLAVVMSAVSVPSSELIARRQPATSGVLRAAGTLKGVAFVLVLLTIGPAWVALEQATDRAEQLSRWELLADQVSAAFFPDGAGDPEAGFRRVMPAFATVVRDAEDESSLALSYLFADEEGEDLYSWAADALGGRWSGFALVNRRWLDLVTTGHDEGRLADVPREELPPPFLDELARNVDGWKRSDGPVETVLAEFEYLAPTGDPVPFLDAGRQLVYRDDVLVVVVPGVWATFNDDFLVRAASSSNLLFTGLEDTQARLESHGLATDIKVRYAAEEGITLAQFAAYEAWLSVASVAGLGAALAVATGISAYLQALLHARNDFVRRLAGRPWLRVLAGRVVPEVLAGASVAAVAVLLQPPDRTLPVVVAAAAILALSPAAHVLAARQGFADVRARRL